jgi:hypothetical protein
LVVAPPEWHRRQDRGLRLAPAGALTSSVRPSLSAATTDAAAGSSLRLWRELADQRPFAVLLSAPPARAITKCASITPVLHVRGSRPSPCQRSLATRLHMISLRCGALPGNVKLLLPPRQSRGNSQRCVETCPPPCCTERQSQIDGFLWLCPGIVSYTEFSLRGRELVA